MLVIVILLPSACDMVHLMLRVRAGAEVSASPRLAFVISQTNGKINS